MHSRHTGPSHRLWLGVVIMVLGVLWTLDNANFVDSEAVLRWWPLIVIAVGVTRLLRRDRSASPSSAALWIGVGLLLLGHTADLWHLWDLWPLLLIVFGAAIVWRSVQGPQAGRSGNSFAGKHADRIVDAIRGLGRGEGVAPVPDGATVAAASGPPESDFLSAVAVWSGVERKNSSQAFRGGDFTALMGGGTIDLRGARTVPGGAVVEVFVMMGGVEIIVPEDWHVVNEAFAFMGGVEDGRKSIPAGPNVLYLKGGCIMGGIEIKN